jgi:hypothetical protein
MSKPAIKCAVSDRHNSTKVVSKDWPIFSDKLASVLSRLEEDQYLTLSAKKGNRFVQFACQGAWGMRVEATSNNFLKDKDRLNDQQVSWLCSNGWNPPSADGTEATPRKDPDGSPNFFIDFPSPVPVHEIASAAIEALINALEIPHPGWLVYEAFDNNKKKLSFEELRLKPATKETDRMMDNVLEVFRKVTGIADLKCDDDGDISVSYGAIVVRAFQVQNKLRLFSGLMADIEESPALLKKLNQLNLGPYGIRCLVHENTVVAAFDLMASPFVAEHLVKEIREFSQAAEGMALELHAEFDDHGLVETSRTSNYIQ